MKNNVSNLKKIALVILVLIAINLVSQFVFYRVDLTSDKRYTLSKTSFDIITKIQNPIYVDVFLEGNFPGEFKKLQTEDRKSVV